MAERWIVITGCSSGIGNHCAIQLQARGWNVIATARKPADLERLAAQGLHSVYMDYKDTRSIADTVQFVTEKTGGKLDALLNNGAYAQQGALEDLPVEFLREQMEANFFGWHDLTRGLLPLMRANGKGRIIQMSSFLGLVALRWRGAYAASKYALEGLSDTLRLELRGSGIDVSLIEPGPIISSFSTTAVAYFRARINVETSPYRDAYQPLFQRFKKGHDSPMTLGPHAVYKKVLHALESPRPKARYYVTLATPMFVWLKRLLPQPILDRFLYWASDK